MAAVAIGGRNTLNSILDYRFSILSARHCFLFPMSPKLNWIKHTLRLFMGLIKCWSTAWSSSKCYSVLFGVYSWMLRSVLPEFLFLFWIEEPSDVVADADSQSDSDSDIELIKCLPWFCIAKHAQTFNKHRYRYKYRCRYSYRYRYRYELELREERGLRFFTILCAFLWGL